MLKQKLGSIFIVLGFSLVFIATDTSDLQSSFDFVGRQISDLLIALMAFGGFAMTYTGVRLRKRKKIVVLNCYGLR